jgi:hypothetical protein
LHFEFGFHQQSDELDGFVTGDPASDAEDHDSLFIGSAHEIKITDLPRACKLLSYWSVPVSSQKSMCR